MKRKESPSPLPRALDRGDVPRDVLPVSRAPRTLPLAAAAAAVLLSVHAIGCRNAEASANSARPDPVSIETAVATSVATSEPLKTVPVPMTNAEIASPTPSTSATPSPKPPVKTVAVPPIRPELPPKLGGAPPPMEDNRL